MTKKIKKGLLLTAFSCIIGVGATGLGYYAYDAAADYDTPTDNITITKNVDLYTFRDGKYSGFADPWGDYYSGGGINKATGWLYESNQNNASITLFDEVIGDFSIVMQPLQEVHNGGTSSESSGAKLNWDFLQFVFTDKADENNILTVDFYESGWFTYNVELHYKGRTFFAYNYGGESFGGAGNYSGWNYVMRVKFSDILNNYREDFLYNLTGFDSYSVSMSMGVKNWGNQLNKTLMVYELCGQKLSGEALTDNAMPQFVYKPMNGVVNHQYTVAPVSGAFDVVDGLLGEEKFTYKVYAPNGSVVTLDSAKSFIPKEAGEYTLTISVKDTAGLENKQTYKFEVFESYPEATFTFVEEYDSAYAMNTPLICIRPTSVVSAITEKEVDYTIEVYHGNEKVKEFGMTDQIAPYELTKDGDYKVVYKTEVETGGYTEKSFTFKSILKPYIPVLEETIVGLNEKFETQVVYAKYNGQSKLMDKVVYGADGNIIALDKDGKFVADTLGTYTVKYSTKFGDVLAESEQIIRCEVIASSLFEKTNGISNILLNRDTTVYSKSGNGMEVYTSAGGVLTSKTFDLDLIETNRLLRFNPATLDEVGTMQQITVALVDAHDSSNYVSMSYWQSPWSFEVIYTTFKYKTVNGEVLGLNPDGNSWSTAYGKSYIEGKSVASSNGGYEGYVSYGCSLIGGMKGMNFIDFQFDYKTGTFYWWDKALFSVYDANCMGPERLWKGFTNNEAYLKITVDSCASTCAYNIVEFLGQSLSGATIDDKTGPYLGLQESVYFDGEDDLPSAIVGQAYPIPDYYAIDYFADVESRKIKVMDSMGSSVKIENGAFTPKTTGTYYLYYEVQDKLGNKQEKLLTIETLAAGDYFTIQWDKEPEAAYTGDTYTVPKLLVSSPVSNLVIEETIKMGEQSVSTETRSIRLMSLDNLVVTIKATDYLGNVLEKEYTIEVNPSELPVLDVEKGMLNSVRVGDEVTLPSFNAYDFNYVKNESGFRPEKWVEINGNKIEGLTFKVDSKMFDVGTVQVVYCAGSGSKVVRSEAYNITVINPVYIGDWFVADKTVNIDYEKTATVFNFNEDTTLKVANNLATSKLMFKFAILSSSKAESVSIRLEDFEDPTISVLLTFTPVDGYYSSLTINGGKNYTVPGSFSNEQEFFTINYNQSSNILTNIYGNLICTLPTTELGYTFNGFPSGSVRVSFVMDCQDEGSIGLRLYQISNQLIVNRFKSGVVTTYTDNTAPVIQLTDTLTNVKLLKGETMNIPAAKAYDFCSAKSSVLMSLVSPSGVKIFDAVPCQEVIEYCFNEYGKYTLVYIANDGTKSYSQNYTIEVIDDTIPVLIISNSQDITVKVGEAFTIPSATVTDDVSNVELYIFLIDEWYLKPIKMNDSLTIDKAGKYMLRYYAVDENYNTVEVQVKVNVISNGNNNGAGANNGAGNTNSSDDGQKFGCGSTIAMSSVACVLTLVGVVFVAKKRED